MGKCSRIHGAGRTKHAAAADRAPAMMDMPAWRLAKRRRDAERELRAQGYSRADAVALASKLVT